MNTGRASLILVVATVALLLSACRTKPIDEATRIVANQVEASLCRAAFTATLEEGKPQAPVVMFKQSEWEGEDWLLYAHPLVPNVAEGGEAKTLVCIRETRTDISGYYYAGSDHVYKLTWDIRIVLLPGGNVVGAGTSEGASIHNNEIAPDPNYQGDANIYSDPPIFDLLKLVAPTLERIFLPGHDIKAIAFSPDGRFLVSAGENGILISDAVSPYLQMWDVATGETALTFDNPGESSCVAFSPDGKSLATCTRIFDSMGFSYGVYIWDTITGKLIREIKTPLVGANSLRYSPDGRLLVGVIEHDVVYWDAKSGEELRRTKVTTGYATVSVGFSPDGKVLAVGVNGSLIFFDPNTGDEIASLATESDYVLSFSPDGKWLASGNPLVVWDSTSCQIVHTLGDGETAAFSPDSAMLVQISGDPEEIVFWDIATGVKIDTIAIVANYGWIDQGEYLKYFNSIYPWLAFSPEGKWLATSAGEGGIIRLWDMSKINQP